MKLERPLRDRGIALATDPSPAYGLESSTGGGRLVRALAAMEAARHPFPVSSTAPHYRRIKSESQVRNRQHLRFGRVLPFVLVVLLRFVRSCGKNGRFGFDFPKLFRANETYTAAGHVGSKNPGDVFHFPLTSQSSVFIERALTHQKANLAFEIEVSAINFFF